MKPLNIIVAGAGMGGLSCALALQQQGHAVHVYERTGELKPIGAAISIWPNGVKILRALGLGPRIDAVSGRMDSMSYRTRAGDLLTHFHLAPLFGSVRETARPIARTALQCILLDAVGRDRVRLGVSCTGFEQGPQQVTAVFSDGSHAHADLLVAADGTRSRLRDAVLGRTVKRNYCGYVNWNGRIQIAPDLGAPHEWAQFVGDHQRVSLMPMGDNQFYFFFDVPLAAGTLDDRTNYREELSRHFDGWAAPVRRLIARLDPARVARIEIHDTDPLEKLVSGRVALLGDAAHAMAPDLGQGGCQAIEDGWVLARSLEATDGEPIAALAAYNAARVERVASIVTRARARAVLIHGRDPVATRSWYEELARENGTSIIAGLRKTVTGGPLA